MPCWLVHRLWTAITACAATVAFAPAQAESLSWCNRQTEYPAPVQDRLLQVAAVLRAELDAAYRISGQQVALVARSGQALELLGHRYSHAGLSLQGNTQTPWAVRQLYFACDEQRPRLFDEGLARFVTGNHNPSLGHLLLLLPPPEAATPLVNTALNDTVALELLSPHYSANAHAWSTAYQNCNQWVAELLATAWAPAPPPPGLDARTRAQAQLRAQGYQPSVIRTPGLPMALGAAFWPGFHTTDHPTNDLSAGQFQVSMPKALADWVMQQWPSTQSIEVCHTEHHLLLRRNGQPLSTTCDAQTNDEVVKFN